MPAPMTREEREAFLAGVHAEGRGDGCRGNVVTMVT
jgi:hypothetical protein